MHTNTKEWLKLIAQHFQEHQAFEWYEDVDEVIERFDAVEMLNHVEKSVFDDIYNNSVIFINGTNFKGLNRFDVEGMKLLAEFLNLQDEFQEWEINNELCDILNLKEN